jgi:hypothetical protein
MPAKQITKIDAVSTIFSGISEIAICDAPADYATATLASLTNWKSLNDIKLDSTNFTGDAPTETLVKNEKGAVVVSTAVAGTNKFEFICYNTSATVLQKMLKASAKSESGAFAADDLFAQTSTVHGFGDSLPILECPIMVVNDVANQAVLFAKAKIVSTMVLDSKVLAIKCTVTAQDISTAYLSTAMVIRGALDVNNA